MSSSSKNCGQGLLLPVFRRKGNRLTGGNDAGRAVLTEHISGDPACRREEMRYRMEALLAERHQRNHVFRLKNDWRMIGNHVQQQPEGDWRNWLLIGGRGSGKTRAGAEWVHLIASASDRSDLRIALVAETLGDAREVMIDGVSGICRIARRKRPDFEASRRRLVWPNGAMAQIFSSEDPESLRGPQFHFAWADELESTFNYKAVITVTYGFHWRMRYEENIVSIRNHLG